MKFIVNKVSGQADLADLQGWLNRRISLLKNGKYLIKIEPYSEKRSVNQNRLMWLWFACIANETGNSKDDIYLVYTHKFLQKEVIFQNVAIKTTERTSSLDTFRFTKFLDQVQADSASELGIQLPNPDDLHFAEFEAYYSRYL